MTELSNIAYTEGLDKERKRTLDALLDVYNKVNGPAGRNAVRRKFFEGDVGYHLRGGLHYFGREDWQKLIKFVKMH